MASKTKKIKASGKFGAGYGVRVRKNYNKIEEEQRKKQVCPYCGKQKAKRTAAGIWNCLACRKVFAGHAYALSLEGKR